MANYVHTWNVVLRSQILEVNVSTNISDLSNRFLLCNDILELISMLSKVLVLLNYPEAIISFYYLKFEIS